MKLKSITFRCSDSQLDRIKSAMCTLKNDNRTEFISTALQEFLDFAEHHDIRELDLFALVERVDRIGSAKSFSRHA